MSETSSIDRMIFVHLGRTGGTTMRQEVLYKCLDPASIYLIDGTEPPVQGGTLEQLLKLPRAQQEKLRAIVGHMPFGIREQLPWPETWHYVTFVRDPVARTVSEYYQVRDSVSHPVHASAMQLSLEKYVRRRCGLSRNGMAKMLSNACYGRKFPNPKAMYKAALRNLNSCTFVGIVESYAESVRRLCKLCGWNMPSIEPRYSLTPKGLELRPEELDIIRRNSVLDQALYDHCRDRFARHSSEELVPVVGRGTSLTYDRRIAGPVRHVA